MSFVDTFGPHLPYLRRFARALTGTQKSGDAFVQAALEALAAGQVQIDTEISAKVALFQMFTGIWSQTGQKLSTAHHSEENLRLVGLTPVYRKAFLLKAMEDFSMPEIATILHITPHEAELLVGEAEAEIEKGLRTNVLIIEDEPIIAADIEDLVGELGHSVDAIAATHATAIAAAEAKRPGLVLADIQLADGSSGIDAVQDILKAYDVPVIFITAFPERLLTGDKPEPAYLIPKPFRPDNVKAAISQALYLHTSMRA